MACKRCGSICQQEFSGELSVSFPYIKVVSLRPVYVCQHVLICLDCGFAELMIPEPELENLRRGILGLGQRFDGEPRKRATRKRAA